MNSKIKELPKRAVLGADVARAFFPSQKSLRSSVPLEIQ